LKYSSKTVDCSVRRQVSPPEYRENGTERVYLEHQRPAPEEPQIPPREGVPVDVEQVLVLVHLLLGRLRPGDVVLLDDAVAVAVVRAVRLGEARHLRVDEVRVVPRNVDEAEARELVVVLAQDVPAVLW
jgi:hypothetical protein